MIAQPNRHRYDIQVRFADMDMMGHLNNAGYATYSEAARLAFLATSGLTGVSIILARLAIDFRRQVRLGEAVRVESWVEAIGTSSFTMRQEMFAAGELAAEISSVLVHFDYERNRSVPISEVARAWLVSWRS
jgi:acyl-CoA thioester hydrolase